MRSFLRSVLAMALFVSGSALAATPYDRFIDECSEVSGNGGCYVEKYDVGAYNYSRAVREFLSDIGEDQIPVFSRGDIYDAIEGAFAVYHDGQEEVLREIQKLAESGKFKGMMAIAPHPDRCTESEYCSYVRVRLYLTDGYLLSFDIDYNT